MRNENAAADEIVGSEADGYLSCEPPRTSLSDSVIAGSRCRKLAGSPDEVGRES